MITIKLAEIYKHRAETTFRPFIATSQLFKQAGIRFVSEGDADMYWISQASLINKKQSFVDCVDRGKRILETYYAGKDYVIFDGSDSASLMGIWEIAKDSDALAVMKNSLYANRDWYYERSLFGRKYWQSEQNDWFNYTHADLDFTRIKLSGTNWLSTVTPQWFKYDPDEKVYDVCALFSYPVKENSEYTEPVNEYYDAHRKNCIDVLRKLSKRLNIKMLEDGKHIPADKYYEAFRISKIIIAPFGYGEIAPRDIESAMFGAVLVKPDMSHVDTIPNIYTDGETYVSCSWDFSNLEEKIDMILGNYRENQHHYVQNMREAYRNEYSQEKLVEHTHNWISNLNGYTTE